MPAKKIAQMAHRHGVEVMLDAAHTFAHLDYKIPDPECDYYGTSLHKWLCAPFGTASSFCVPFILLSPSLPEALYLRCIRA